MFTLYKRNADLPTQNDCHFESMEHFIHREKRPDEPITIGLIKQVYDDLFRNFSSIGCYTILFVDDCDVLCADCARKRFILENKPITMATYDEGRTLYCEDCNCEIESSYGPIEED